jgi:hypothetical protein
VLVSLIVLLPILVVSGALLILSSYTSNRIESELATALVRTTAGKVGMRVMYGLVDAERTSALYTHRITTGSLPPQASPAWERLMYESLLIRPNTGSITYAWPDGRCLYVMRDGDEFVVGRCDGPGDGQTREYRLDNNGHADGEPIRTFQFVARERPWYTHAITHDGPGWTDVYLWFSGTPTVYGRKRVASVSYTRALRAADGTLNGVLSIDMTMPQVSDVLREAEIAKMGSLFVVDDSGRLLADSIGMSSEMPAILPSIYSRQNHDAQAAAAVLQTGASNNLEDNLGSDRHVYIEPL